MAIGDDTAIDYTNRIINLTGSTIYDVSVLYSYCKEQFKLSANIDDDFAWTANTPTDFTLKNGWYLRTGSIRRLKNGGIKTAYGLDEIERINLASGGYTNFIESDIGKVVVATGLGASDVLVDFDNTRRTIWVRTSGTARSVGDSVAVSVTAGTGAGTSTGTSVGSTTGTDDQWTNINTIGDLVGGNTNPYMYVYTGSLTTGDNLGNSRKNIGYNDDPDQELTNADRGVIDALIRIKDMNTFLGNPAGEIHVYARTGLDTFSDFAINISAGGRIAVPVSNSDDVEDTLGDYCFAYDGASAGNFTIGEEITEDTATPAWKAEVVLDIPSSNDLQGILIVRGLTALPSDGQTFTGTTSGEAGTMRGTAGGQLLAYDAQTAEIDDPTDYGVTVTGGTSGAKGIIRGNITIAEGASSIGYVVLESNHDVEADGTFYTAFADNEVITGTGVSVTTHTTGTGRYDRLCSDLDDVRVKSAFQRLTGITAGNAAVGDNITQATSGAKGTIIQVISASEIHVSSNNGIAFNTANTISDDDGGSISGTPTTAPRDETFTYEFPLQSTGSLYNILIEGSGRTNKEIYHYLKYFQQANSTNAFPSSDDQAKELYLLKQELGGGGLISQLIQGEEYFRAFTDEDTPSNSYTAQDAKSRLAVKNGSTLVTGQGVAIINNASADANNLTFTNSAGVQNSPFISVVVNITTTVAGDHVEVVLASGGQEDKAQVTSGVGNSVGNTSIVLNASLPNDTPTGAGNTGVIKMVDDSSTSTINKEMRYRYSSYSGTTVTLSTGESGTASATNANPLILEDTGAFTGTTIQVGDPIRNILDGSIAWVTEIIDNNTIRTTQLEGGGTNNWISGDTWETNTLVVAYVNGTDTGYIPYIDRVATGTNEDETLTFVTPRSVVIRVRNTSILDFDTTGTIGSGGLTVGTVRNPDGVFLAT